MSAWGLGMVLVCAAAASANANVAKATLVLRPCNKCDPGPQSWKLYPHGDVQIDRKRFLTTDGQARLVALGPDHQTVGWVTGPHDEAEHGETVLLSTELSLWRDEQIVHIHRDGFIHAWVFFDKGKQVALATGPVRDVRYYSLYDAASGELIESHPSYGYEHARKPRWVALLDKALGRARP